MKKIILVVVVSFIFQNLFAQNEPDKLIFDHKILLNLGTEYQVLTTPVNLTSYRGESDFEEMLNTQFLSYEVDIKLYKKLFLTLSQHFSYDYIGLKDYDNPENNLIQTESVKGLYVKNTFSLLYFFKLKKQIFNVKFGVYSNKAKRYMVAYFQNPDNGFWYPYYLENAYHYGNFIELNYIKNNIQIGVGYHFQNEVYDFSVSEYELNLIHFRLAYTIKKW